MHSATYQQQQQQQEEEEEEQQEEEQASETRVCRVECVWKSGMTMVACVGADHRSNQRGKIMALGVTNTCSSTSSSFSTCLLFCRCKEGELGSRSRHCECKRKTPPVQRVEHDQSISSSPSSNTLTLTWFTWSSNPRPKRVSSQTGHLGIFVLPAGALSSAFSPLSLLALQLYRKQAVLHQESRGCKQEEPNLKSIKNDSKTICNIQHPVCLVVRVTNNAYALG